MYHCYFEINLCHNSYVYANMCKSDEKFKIKDFNSPSNEPQIVLGYFPKNFEEYFHLRNSDNINISEDI